MSKNSPQISLVNLTSENRPPIITHFPPHIYELITNYHSQSYHTAGQQWPFSTSLLRPLGAILSTEKLVPDNTPTLHLARHKGMQAIQAPHVDIMIWWSQIARFMVPTWGPSRADRTQVGPMLAPWILLSGDVLYMTYPLWQESQLSLPQVWTCHLFGNRPLLK